MSVGLLLITHKNVGQALIDTAFEMLDARPLEPTIIEVSTDCDIVAPIDKPPVLNPFSFFSLFIG